MKTGARLEGLDVARFLAFVGMVIVNFNIVMTGGYADDFAFSIAEHLQGRAAAAFVVLAGIGLGLAARQKAWTMTVTTTLKRALFLLVLGLLNAAVFDADIIHYYAVYFLFSLVFLRASSWVLWSAIAGLVFVSTCMIIGLEFDRGWNWADYSYADFWTMKGFLRNLFFNGWHPVLPWFSFMLFGIWLSRLNLKAVIIRRRLVLYGAGALVIVTLMSDWLMGIVSPVDVEAALLFSTSPVPAFPLYMVAGAGFASALIGICLYIEAPLRRLRILPVFTVPGRQTLTLYIAHIFLGMGVLEALGRAYGQTPDFALFTAAIFCIASVVFSLIWSKFFSRGPLEMLMRRVT